LAKREPKTFSEALGEVLGEGQSRSRIPQLDEPDSQEQAPSSAKGKKFPSKRPNPKVEGPETTVPGSSSAKNNLKKIQSMGRRGQPYRPYSAREHENYLGSLDLLPGALQVSPFPAGYALLALSLGEVNPVCLEAQIASNNRFLKNAWLPPSSPRLAGLDTLKQSIRARTGVLERKLGAQRRWISKRNSAAAAKRLEIFRQEELARKEAKKARAERLGEIARERERNKEEARQRVQPWKDAVDQLLKPMSYGTKVLTPELDQQDEQLINEWMPIVGTPSRQIFERGRLLSARAAEKAAAEIYRKAGFDVEDVSISQLKNDGAEEWKKYDLRVGHALIDVKNARRNFTSPDNYTEHCVSRFKRNRELKEVSISGYLSPYISDFDEDSKGQKKEEPILFLGETSGSYLQKLGRYFSNESLDLFFSRDQKGAYFIPSWAYEYPRHFYGNSCLDSPFMFSADWPSSEDFRLLGVKSPYPLLALLNSGQKDSGGWHLHPNSLNISKRIASNLTQLDRSRPVLWLTILTEILTLIRSGIGVGSWSPMDLARAIFFSEDRDRVRPLGFYDPLKTIESLLSVLDSVWIHCREQVTQFDAFRLTNSNILSGRESGTGGWQTIIAYCGGWKYRGEKVVARCGNNPIYLGRESSCGACGKLICSECGFCERACPDCEESQKAMSKDVDSPETNPFE